MVSSGEREVEKDARVGRKKTKRAGDQPKKQRRVWPGNSGIKYDSDSSGGGGWSGGRQLQVDDLAMGPSHTLFVMGIPSRRAANSNKQQFKVGKHVSRASHSKKERGSDAQHAQALPSHGQRRDPFFPSAGTARSKFSGARNHSCPINLTLTLGLAAAATARLMSTCLFNVT